MNASLKKIILLSLITGNLFLSIEASKIEEIKTSQTEVKQPRTDFQNMTPDNIAEFVQPAPKEIKEQVEKLLIDNKDLINKMIDPSRAVSGPVRYTILETFPATQEAVNLAQQMIQQYQKEGKSGLQLARSGDGRAILIVQVHSAQTELDKEIADRGLKNLGKNSYAFELDTKDYIFKTILIRLSKSWAWGENINAALGRAWKTPLDERTFDDYVAKNGKDFHQTISRNIMWLQYLQAIKDHKLDRLAITPSWLVKIPWISSPKISDQTAVVVDAKVDGLPLNNSNVMKNIDKEVFDQLYTIMTLTGLWDIAGGSNVLVKQFPGKEVLKTEELQKEEGPHQKLETKAFFVDLEKPANIAGLYKLSPESWHYWHNVFAGAEGLYNLAKEGGRNDIADLIAKRAIEDLNKHGHYAGDQIPAFKDKPLRDQKNRISPFFTELEAKLQRK